MLLARLLNACHHFPGFVYAAVRLIEATGTIEVDVQRPWRSPGANGPEDRLRPGSPRRIAAMIFSSPPQFGQCSRSISNTRLSSRAQLSLTGW